MINDNIKLLVENDADMVCFNYATYEFNNKFVPHIEVDDKLYDGHKLRKMLFDAEIIVTVWSKLFRKEIWRELRFPVGMNFEDTFVLPDILVKANKIVCNKNIYYFYNRTNEKSITRTEDSIKRQLIILQVYFHKLDIIRVYYKELYLENLQIVINQCLKLYNLNSYKSIVDEDISANWKNFVVKEYDKCKNISFKDRLYIWGIKYFKVINYIKGYEYYCKYKKRGDF